MLNNPDIHHRKSIRLNGYDYTQNGAYFITICIQNKECLFGEIENGKMILNDAGKMIKKLWTELGNKFVNFELDAFVVMPNHFHGIVVIENVGVPLVGTQNNITKGQPQGIAPTEFCNVEQNGQPQGIAPTNTKTIGDFIGAFKSLTTNEYIRGVKNGKFPIFEKRIWQRNYYEHIIRNEKSYEKISGYIIHNPEKWQEDDLYEN